MKLNQFLGVLIIGFLLALSACKKDKTLPQGPVYDPTPYTFNILGPSLPNVTTIEGMTVEAVRLGQHLFYDPILSADSTLSCSGCHIPELAFTDALTFSVGIDGIAGTRQSMPIFNMVYNDALMFWDGRANSLEEQALLPIQDPIEMHEMLPNVLAKLSRHPLYPDMFFEAYGVDEITPDLIADAIAQFERSIISQNSLYDKAKRGEAFLPDEAADGEALFASLTGGDCFHCHTLDGVFTDNTFRSNGIDSFVRYIDFPDPGLGAITGDTADYGKFKVPTLRNIALTPPYMHDGRFETLDEVLDFYSEGVHDTPFTDPLIEFAYQGGVQLTEEEKDQIIAFLHTLTDTTFMHNPAYANPWE